MSKNWFFLLLPVLCWQLIKKLPDESVHLVVCDVCQGDAILVQQANFQLLIDTGPDEQVVTCLNQQLPLLDKKIDILVLTHYDDDHIGGMAALAQGYQFGTIFTPLTDYKDSQVFLELEQLFLELTEQGTAVKQPILGQQIAYHHQPALPKPGNQAGKSKQQADEQLLFTLITPLFLESDWQSQYLDYQAKSRLPEGQFEYLKSLFANSSSRTESNNDRSISLLMQFGQLKTFFSGDLEENSESSILESGLITRVDILKVAHHGSKTSSSQAFLSRVQPETSLISLGANNQFNHPSPEVIKRLNHFSQHVFRTDQAGELDFLLTSDYYLLLNHKHKLF